MNDLGPARQPDGSGGRQLRAVSLLSPTKARRRVQRRVHRGARRTTGRSSRRRRESARQVRRAEQLRGEPHPDATGASRGLPASPRHATGTGLASGTARLTAARRRSPGTPRFGHRPRTAVRPIEDDIVDSAGHRADDPLRLANRAPGGCTTGVVPVERQPTVRITSPFDHGATDDTMPVVSGTPATRRRRLPGHVALRPAPPCSRT